MKILLDTNALIWLISEKDGGPLGKNARELLQNAEAVYASSVNILEIRIKTLLGKLESDNNLLDDSAAAGLESLMFASKHADALMNFPDLSKHDPFDRMLLAQAQTEGMVLLTSDTTLLGLKLPYLANARR